jgi:putative thioredoxin
VLLDRRQDDEAGELLGRATPPGELGPEIDRLRAILALRGLCRGLPDAPTLRGQLQQTPDNAQLRYQLGCVLAAAGRYTEALEELLAAASADLKLAQGQAKEAMVQVFQIVGSPLADEYRRKLTQLLY